MVEAKDNKWTQALHNKKTIASQTEILKYETKAAVC